jgi:hypothetical protein
MEPIEFGGVIALAFALVRTLELIVVKILEERKEDEEKIRVTEHNAFGAADREKLNNIHEIIQVHDPDGFRRVYFPIIQLQSRFDRIETALKRIATLLERQD